MKTQKANMKLGAFLLTLGGMLAGCFPTSLLPSPASPSPSPFSTIPSNSFTQTPITPVPTKARIQAPPVPADDASQLAQGNSAFAVALYQQIRRQDGNLFVSPYSISLALAMTYAGARGATADQMAQAMHFTLPQSRLHPAFNALDQTIASYAQEKQNTQANPSPGFRLSIANSIWGQQGFPFQSAFLDVLSQNYGAGLQRADFIHAPDPSRVIINNWVEQNTGEKIADLFPPESITSFTRLVLANAVYFKAAWENSFDPTLTKAGTFFLSDGSTLSVPIMGMGEANMFPCRKEDDYQAVELPYAGGHMVMAVIMPTGKSLADFEAGLTEESLNSILTGMENQNAFVTLPKFKVESGFDLGNTLASMGMTDAFQGNADFSGMDGAQDLFISKAVHKAFVTVDENGTEAAAATGVSMSMKAIFQANILQITIDHPFLFAIYDPDTGTLLFMGRVLNPGK